MIQSNQPPTRCERMATASPGVHADLSPNRRTQVLRFELLSHRHGWSGLSSPQHEHKIHCHNLTSTSKDHGEYQAVPREKRNLTLTSTQETTSRDLYGMQKDWRQRSNLSSQHPNIGSSSTTLITVCLVLELGSNNLLGEFECGTNATVLCEQKPV